MPSTPFGSQLREDNLNRESSQYIKINVLSNRFRKEQLDLQIYVQNVNVKGQHNKKILCVCLNEWDINIRKIYVLWPYIVRLPQKKSAGDPP